MKCKSATIALIYYALSRRQIDVSEQKIKYYVPIRFDVIRLRSICPSRKAALSSVLIFLIIFAVTDNFHSLLSPSYSLNHTTITLDEFGIPLVQYSDRNETEIGRQRNPLTVAQTAISFYETYMRTPSDRLLSAMVNNSNWLVTNALAKGNYSILQYQFPWPPYDLQPPWQSGMAQARAIQALTRAHELTGNQTYLDTAKSLLNAFFVEVKDGGVTYKTPNEGWWYELYAGPGAVESRALNGMTFALLGIYDYYKYTNDTAAQFLFDQGILSLKNNLPKYDYVGGRYSTYDVLNENHTKPAQFKYHLAQTAHLGKLHDITGEQFFKTYHDKWSDFDLPESMSKRLKIYEKANEIDLNFTLMSESESGKFAIRKSGNITANTPATIAIEWKHVNGNSTAHFVSPEFSYMTKQIAVGIGDRMGSETQLRISFIVNTEGKSGPTTITFNNSNVTEGWSSINNYNIGVDPDSLQTIHVRDLFEDNYMLLRQVTIDITDAKKEGFAEVKICLS